MSSKERLCVCCGSFIGWRGFWRIEVDTIVKTAKWGAMHFSCWVRTGGPLYRESR